MGDMRSKHVLSLDLGKNTGYALYNLDKGMLVDSGVIVLSGKTEAEMLQNFYTRYFQFFWTYNLKYVVVEEPYIRFVSAAKRLYGYRAIIMLTEREVGGITVLWFSATKVKKSATGSGRASKDQMIKAASEYFRLDNSKALDNNEADALCVLSCFLEGRKHGY